MFACHCWYWFIITVDVSRAGIGLLLQLM